MRNKKRSADRKTDAPRESAEITYACKHICILKLTQWRLQNLWPIGREIITSSNHKKGTENV